VWGKRLFLVFDVVVLGLASPALGWAGVDNPPVAGASVAPTPEQVFRSGQSQRVIDHATMMQAGPVAGAAQGVVFAPGGAVSTPGLSGAAGGRVTLDGLGAGALGR